MNEVVVVVVVVTDSVAREQGVLATHVKLKIYANGPRVFPQGLHLLAKHI